MNIQQFQYLLAVAEYKHFELAAEKCFITQSTLSTMISKFEDEIGIKIFDRKKKPVELTNEGSIIIEQLRIIDNNINQLKEITKELKGELGGTLNLSVIPTIAPFLLPLFLQKFANQFQNLSIVVKEETTEEIIKKIKSREIDIGIVSTPLDDKDLVEIKLYDEPFVFFDAKGFSGEKVSVDQVKTDRLCLMEEGHCMRTQILELCNQKFNKIYTHLNYEYKAGSIDSLIRFVKANQLSTLLPYLSTLEFSENEKKFLFPFTKPIPYRSIGLVIHPYFIKKKVLNKLQENIINEINGLLPLPSSNTKILHPLNKKVASKI